MYLGISQLEMCVKFYLILIGRQNVFYKRIYESPRRLSTVNVKHIRVSIPWGSLYGVVIWQETVHVEVTSLIKTNGSVVRRQNM